MSKKVYNAAAVCNLRHPSKAVLKELAWFANDEGHDVWPSVSLIAIRTGLTRRGVQKILRGLEHVGAIRGLGSRLGGRGKTTRYCIALDWMRENPETASPVRRLYPDQASATVQNSECESPERVNAESQNSEPRSPEQEEHEFEKERSALKDRDRPASAYEQQRLRRRIRNQAGGLFMPSPMSRADRQARKLILKEQAEFVRKKRLA